MSKARNVGVADYEFPLAPAPQEPDRANACPLAAPCGQAENAPAPPFPAGAVVLSVHQMILVRAIAGYEQCDNATAIEMALVTHANRIGAGPLARAVLDERERLSGLRADSAIVDDIADVPAFERAATNRFRSGGP